MKNFNISEFKIFKMNLILSVVHSKRFSNFYFKKHQKKNIRKFKFYSKKNHRKNNTSFKNSAPALPDNHLDDAKPVQKKIITAIELTPLQQEHENEKNILRKISALKKSSSPFTWESDDTITKIIASYHRVITENKKIRENSSVNEIKTLNDEIVEQEGNIKILENMRSEKDL